MLRWALPNLPGGADTALHTLRAVELLWAIQNGHWWPRYAPDLAYGYGYPLFAAYGLGAQYVILAWHALGLQLVPATLAAFALCDAVGALGAFALARARFGSLAGWLAAAMYAYSPYILMSLHRGALPEAIGLALLPWLWWSLARGAPQGALSWAGLIRHSTPTALALAGILVSHNPSSALAAGTAAVVLIASVALAPAPERRRVGTIGLSGLGLGLGLSAFFWLPVLFDAPYLSLSIAYANPVMDYRNNFLGLSEVLALPQPYDVRLIGEQVPRALSWPALALTVLALMRWPALDRIQRTWWVGAVLGAGLFAGLTLTVAAPAWELIPGLRLIQFPSRLLGPASLMLALAAAAVRVERPASSVLRHDPEQRADRGGLPVARRWVRAPEAQGVVLLAALASVMVNGAAWMTHFPDLSVPPQPTLADLHSRELRTGTVGTTTAGEYYPIWVSERPPPDKLVARYAYGPLITRFDPASLPAGARLLDDQPGFLTEIVVVDTPTAFTAVFELHFFPGWQARVNGAAAETRPLAPYGFLGVEVPTGQQTLSVFFGSTPAREGAGWISGLTLVLVASGWAGAWRARRRDAAAAAPIAAAPPSRAVPGWVWAGGALLVALAALNTRSNLWVGTRFDPVSGQLADVGQARADDFGGLLRLIGLDVPAAAVAADQDIDVRLYWAALQPMHENLSVQLTLRDGQGVLVAQSDTQNPADRPTSTWALNHYARDTHRLRLMPGTPPGVYRLFTTVYRQGDLAQLRAPVESGTVTLGRALRPVVLTPENPMVVDLSTGVLLGHSTLPAEIGVGERLPVRLYWRATDSSEGPPVIPVWRSAAGQRWATEPLPASPKGLESGDEWQAVALVHVPAALPSGTYDLWLEGRQATVLGQLRVVAPLRSDAVPALAHPRADRFGEVAELVGWEYAAGELRLAWRALSSPGMRYRLFVHALGTDGEIASQADFEPQAGGRPTTSWLAGEVLVERIALDLPPGSPGFRVGWYDPATSERLRLPNGDEFVLLR
jgi:hypothetical protein